MSYISDEQLYEIFLSCGGVCTDTRKITPKCLFFALKGPNFDGNVFAAKALKAGASYAVVDDPEAAGGSDRFLLVKDGLAALQRVANFHRRKFDIPFIVITGSNGKTTTKELTGAVLEKKYKTLVTQGNLNNHIGVPLTLLKLKKQHEIAVIETGANHVGEIAELCKIVEPTHGLITNIGKAHIEGFGGLQGIIKGKGELYDYLSASGGTVFVNSKNEFLAKMIDQRTFNRVITYPAKNDYIHVQFECAAPFINYKNESGKTGKTQLIGKYNFDNIAAALCIGKFFAVSEQDADEAVTNYLPQNNRSQLIKKGSNTIILDAYNANPDSMRAAVEAFAEMDFDRKVLLLGDMFELGDTTAAEHEMLINFTAQFDFDQLLFFGKAFYAFKENFNHLFFRDSEEALTYFQNQPFKNSAFLLKGSRGMQLEKLIELL